MEDNLKNLVVVAVLVVVGLIVGQIILHTPDTMSKPTKFALRVVNQ